MELGVDAVPNVSADHSQVLRFGVLLNDIAEFFDGNTGPDVSNSLVQALPGCLDQSNNIGIRLCLVAYIISLVKISVVAIVEE